jgi:hypothetical protein
MRTSKNVKINALLNLRAFQRDGFILDKDFTSAEYVTYLINARYVKRIDPVPITKWARLEVTQKGREKLEKTFQGVL